MGTVSIKGLTLIPLVANFTIQNDAKQAEK